MKRHPGLFALPLAICLLLGCVLSPPSPRTVPNPNPASTLTATSTWTPTPTPSRAVSATPTPSPAATWPAAFWDWDDLIPYKKAMLAEFASDVDGFADATRYMIDLQVDPESLTVQGTAHVRYTNHQDEPLAELVFRLLSNTPGFGGETQVEAILLDGKQARFDHRFEDSAVYVPFEEPLSPGKTAYLLLAFRGTLPADASAGYAQYGYFDRVLALPSFYPMVPAYDDEGWNVELAPTYADATFGETALYLVRLTLPSDLVVVTSGVTIDQQENGNGTTTTTCASGPMRDFSIVASADYAAVSDTVGQILVTSYYLPGDEPGGRRALDYATRALQVYQDLFGPYPFSELDVVATPTEAGGIEYPGLFVIARHLYDREGGFFELATVHETAHQWWYSLVGNDQIDEPWLDEALSQYTSLLYFEHYYGESVAQSLLRDSFEGWYKSLEPADQDMAIGLPVASYAEHVYGAIVYGKGPLFFHEMRRQVGDETFFQILRTYLERYRYGIAYPQDLIDTAEAVAEQDLDDLYQTWVLGQ